MVIGVTTVTLVYNVGDHVDDLGDRDDDHDRHDANHDDADNDGRPDGRPIIRPVGPSGPLLDIRPDFHLETLTTHRACTHKVR